jgi:hypothetical protein
MARARKPPARGAPPAVAFLLLACCLALRTAGSAASPARPGRQLLQQQQGAVAAPCTPAQIKQGAASCSPASGGAAPASNASAAANATQLEAEQRALLGFKAAVANWGQVAAAYNWTGGQRTRFAHPGSPRHVKCSAPLAPACRLGGGLARVRVARRDLRR